MEELRDLFCYPAILVVDECIEDAGDALQRKDVVIGDGQNQAHSGLFAVGNDAGTGGHCTHLPAFANRLIRGGKAFVTAEVVATPDYLVEIGLKKERVELHLEALSVVSFFDISP